MTRGRLSKDFDVPPGTRSDKCMRSSMALLSTSSLPYGFAGFGSRSVHEPPNTIVRPCGRALAMYSGSYLKKRFRPFAGRMKLL
jgi:hypothetical protein